MTLLQQFDGAMKAVSHHWRGCARRVADRARHAFNAAIGHGQLAAARGSTFVALVEFGLSTRTDASGTVYFDNISGERRVEVPRSKAQTGVALGPSTIFDL
jgi:hypothetical protein